MIITRIINDFLLKKKNEKNSSTLLCSECANDALIKGHGCLIEWEIIDTSSDRKSA